MPFVPELLKPSETPFDGKQEKLTQEQLDRLIGQVREELERDPRPRKIPMTPDEEILSRLD